MPISITDQRGLRLSWLDQNTDWNIFLHSQRDALELNLTYRSNKILSKETNRWFSTQMWYLIHLWFHMQTAVYNNGIALLLFPADHSLSTEKKKWSGETHWCVRIHTGEKIICTDIRKSLCIILWSHIGHSVDMNLNRGRSKGGPSLVVIIIILKLTYRRMWSNALYM